MPIRMIRKMFLSTVKAWEFADMGLIPAGAYRNREYTKDSVFLKNEISRTMQIFYTIRRQAEKLFIALPKEEAAPCLRELRPRSPEASVIGSVKEYGENWIVLNLTAFSIKKGIAVCEYFAQRDSFSSL